MQPNDKTYRLISWLPPRFRVDGVRAHSLQGEQGSPTTDLTA